VVKKGELSSKVLNLKGNFGGKSDAGYDQNSIIDGAPGEQLRHNITY
jgi:hypothetical protein